MGLLAVVLLVTVFGRGMGRLKPCATSSQVNGAVAVGVADLTVQVTAAARQGADGQREVLRDQIQIQEEIRSWDLR